MASALDASHAMMLAAHKPSSCSRQRVNDPGRLPPIGWARSAAKPIPELTTTMSAASSPLAQMRSCRHDPVRGRGVGVKNERH